MTPGTAAVQLADLSRLQVLVQVSEVDVNRLKTGQDHDGWVLRMVQGRDAIFAKGKRSVTLDVKTAGGREILTKLIAGADVAGNLDGHADGAAGIRQEGERADGAEEADLASLVGGHVAGRHDHRISGHHG